MNAFQANELSKKKVDSDLKETLSEIEKAAKQGKTSLNFKKMTSEAIDGLELQGYRVCMIEGFGPVYYSVGW